MIRLLIADDEALERETLADIVARRFEHEVTIETAENGRKAADTAVLWGADLILMDIEMPGMNGLDAARAVLEQRPECKVIFVTAYSLFQYAHEAMHLGACDYLLKPVNPDEVEASIRKAIRQIEAGRRLAELAPVEPEPEADPESDAAEAGENDRNALVMAHVRKYMEDNYMFDLSLDSVSEILHISPAYLSAQFKKYQKMNFLDCLTELRINAAKELPAVPARLRQTGRSASGGGSQSGLPCSLGRFPAVLGGGHAGAFFKGAGKIAGILVAHHGSYLCCRTERVGEQLAAATSRYRTSRGRS